MVYSELPTLSLLQSWGRQEFLTSRVGISPHMIQETLSLLSSLAVQREIVSVSGLPGLITLITLPVKVDHREKRERREWVRGGRSVNRSAVSECGPGAGSCDLAAVIWVTHGLSLGSLSLSLSTFQWPLTGGGGVRSVPGSHMWPLPGYVTRVKTGAARDRAPAHAGHYLSNA